MRRVRVTNLPGIAIGIGRATTIEIVGHHVAVFIEAIAAFGDVIITGAAIIVGTIDFAVAIVIDSIRACTCAKLRLPWLSQITCRTITKRGAIGIRAIDIPITVIVFAVVTHLHGIRLDEHIEDKRAFVGSKIGIDGVSIQEDVIRSRIKKREIQLRRPLHATAVIVARNLFTRVAFTGAHVKHRIERCSDRIEHDVRRIRQDEIENSFASISAACAFGFADIAGGIARVRARPRNEFRGQTVGLLHDTNGRIRAIGILAIDESIVVVIGAVVAHLRFGHAIRSKETRRIGTIDFVVAIVVLTVVANLRCTALTRRRNEARRIGAIDEFVAVFVLPSRTHFGLAWRYTRARVFPGAIRVRAIDEQIAIVVRLVVTRLDRILTSARFRCRAIAVVAVDLAIAIVIESVVTHRRLVRQTSACGSTQAIRIEAIDDHIAIVVEAIATIFPVR